MSAFRTSWYYTDESGDLLDVTVPTLEEWLNVYGSNSQVTAAGDAPSIPRANFYSAIRRSKKSGWTSTVRSFSSTKFFYAPGSCSTFRV